MGVIGGSRGIVGGYRGYGGLQGVVEGYRGLGGYEFMVGII